MMNLEKIYFTTMSLLIFHQIDAAYWQEWRMFHLPGGIQGYLVFNIIAVPIILLGYKKIITKSQIAFFYSYICGALGVVTFILHVGFAIFGAEEFGLPLSILIIFLCFVFGLWQIFLTRRLVDGRNIKDT